MLIKIPFIIIKLLKVVRLYEVSKIIYRKYFIYSGILKNDIESVLFYRSYNLKKGSFFDVGCYKGSKIDQFLNIDKTIKIIAIEPFQKYYCDLVKKYTNYKNIEIFNLAASDKIYKKNKFFYNNLTLDKEAFSLIKNARLNKHVYIKSCKIDSFIDRNPKIIKIDTEGFELKVLKGAKNIIKKKRPIFFIEVTNKTFNETIKILSSERYNVFIYEYSFFKKKLHNNWKKNNLVQNNVFEQKIYSINEIKKFKFKNFMFNVICVPNENCYKFKDLLNP